MPTPRKTIEQHITEGTYRADRHGPRPDDSELSLRLAPAPPDLLSEPEREVWAAFYPLLCDRLKPSDVSSFIEFCRWQTLRDQLAAKLHDAEAGTKGFHFLLVQSAIVYDKLDKLYAKLGLSPIDRAKLRAGEPVGPKRNQVPTRPQTALDRAGPPKKQSPKGKK